MEEIQLVTKEYIIYIKNALNEKILDYIGNHVFKFKSGYIYGIICEQGGGGEYIASALSNNIVCNADFFINGKKVFDYRKKDIGWYVGNQLYNTCIFKKEISVRKALKNAIKENTKYRLYNEVVEDFHLTEGRLDYCLSNCSWEKWRASLAIGYASGKKIFCFPWLNSMFFYDMLINAELPLYLKKVANDGGIIILPTSKEENVKDLVDEIIILDEDRFNLHISNNRYFMKLCEENMY